MAVIGASYAGFICAEALAKSLPSGFPVVLIEKNSHLNYTWLVPRISVMPRHDHLAFVPYPVDGVKNVPKDLWVFKRWLVTKVESDPQENNAILDNGDTRYGSNGKYRWSHSQEEPEALQTRCR